MSDENKQDFSTSVEIGTDVVSTEERTAAQGVIKELIAKVEKLQYEQQAHSILFRFMLDTKQINETALEDWSYNMRLLEAEKAKQEEEAKRANGGTTDPGFTKPDPLAN